ncbi:MAG: hypothetical protein LBK12_04920 [Odoribacteraceae bacterium]|jgi:cell fate regulator YaaT (PSP1 superfamily)|nr:hypothetical protein [Odoribacteraceae bacterium]
MDENIQEELEENPKIEREKILVKAVPVIDHRLLASKLTVHDWMQDVPSTGAPSDLVEVRFKNTRKGFFANPGNFSLKVGDIVAVEAALGHDIGIVSLMGELVREQVRLKRVDIVRNPLKKIYRKAKSHDIDKWRQAIALEYETMIKSRKIASDLGLDMKIGDVEYQGDKTKAIFYYIAGDRVDFRKLIKILAETFHIRIEMKQIGARQEAGRLGGIGSCGRKLCCCSFITNFSSVSTSSARYQDISLNPQKLAGQCGKLKCCLNFELDAYIDGQKDFPSSNTWLNTGEGMLYFQKSDIFGRSISYSFDKEGRGIIVKLPVERAKEIIAMNKRGQIPPKASVGEREAPESIKYTDGVGEDSLNRFDDKRPKKHNNRNRDRKKMFQKQEAKAPDALPGNPGNGGNEAPANPNKGAQERHRHHRNHPRLNKPQAPSKPEAEA